jgi:hypothetical protein
MSTILQKAGLDPVTAAGYGTAIKIVNSAMTIVAIVLVERRGRVFLLKLGTAGIVLSLCVLAGIFYKLESRRVDVMAEVVTRVQDNRLDIDLAQAALAHGAIEPLQLTVLYHYGDQQQVAEAFMPTAESRQVLAQEEGVKRGLAQPVRDAIDEAEALQLRAGKLNAGEQLAIDQARKMLAALPPERRAIIETAQRIRAGTHLHIAPPGAGQQLVIDRARVGPIPARSNGLLTALCIGAFIAFFSIGPGVCVWLALSELMPTRIRSVGMGVALLINQGTGTLIAAAFLPIVGNYGFYAMFLFWAGCTVVYFITAAFFLPETKGKTLEQIEAYFSQRRTAAPEPAPSAEAQH